MMKLQPSKKSAGITSLYSSRFKTHYKSSRDWLKSSMISVHLHQVWAEIHFLPLLNWICAIFLTLHWFGIVREVEKQKKASYKYPTVFNHGLQRVTSTILTNNKILFIQRAKTSPGREDVIDLNTAKLMVC